MLLVEMLVAAHRCQVEDAVLASVIKTLTAGDLLEIASNVGWSRYGP